MRVKEEKNDGHLRNPLAILLYRYVVNPMAYIVQHLRIATCNRFSFLFMSVRMVAVFSHYHSFTHFNFISFFSCAGFLLFNKISHTRLTYSNQKRNIQADLDGISCSYSFSKFVHWCTLS